MCLYNQPSASEGVGVNTIITTDQKSGSEKKKEGQFENSLLQFKTAVKWLQLGLSSVKPSAYSLCFSPESEFRLALIKVTVVVGVQRFWMHDREKPWYARSHLLLCACLWLFQRCEHQTQHFSTGFGSVIATARASTSTTTPEIDGQLKSERRRLERVICESSSNMQNEFSLHLPWAKERERERAREKRNSSLSISDLPRLNKEASRENKTAA